MRNVLRKFSAFVCPSLPVERRAYADLTKRKKRSRLRTEERGGDKRGSLPFLSQPRYARVLVLLQEATSA